MRRWTRPVTRRTDLSFVAVFICVAGCRRCSVAAAPDAGLATSVWTSHPDGASDFVSVIEGPCARLRASVVGTDIFLHDQGLVARWSGTTPSDASRLSRGIESTRVGWIDGTFPDNAWLHHSSAAVGDHAMRWDKDRWEPTWGDASGLVGRFHVTQHGAVAITRDLVGMPSAPDVGPRGPTDPIRDADVRDDETFAIVMRGMKLEARRVRGGAVTALSIPQMDAQIFVTPHHAFVSAEDFLADWTGTAWSRLASPSPSRLTQIEEDPSGMVWLVTDAKKILRIASPGTYVDVTPSAGAPIRFAGANVGAPYAIAGDKLWRWDGITWSLVSLPKPSHWPSAVMIPNYIVVKDAKEAWVQASYPVDQFHTGSGSARSALLRQGPAPRTTLRCMPSDFAHPMAGFVDWPPLADETCNTPFVILAVSDKPTDWKKEIADIGDPRPTGLVEITIGPAHYLGAPASSFDGAEKLALRVPTMSEVVCGTPLSPRPVR